MDVTAHREWDDASRPAAPAPCDFFRAVGNELHAAVQCECRAVGGAALPWLDAGRVHWRLKGGCRAGTRNETRGWDARPDGVHASREVGCAAQGVGHVQL